MNRPRQPEIIVLDDSSDESSEDATPSPPRLPPSRPKLKVKRRPSPSPTSSSASSVSTPSSVQRHAVIAALEVATAMRRTPTPGKKLSTKMPTGGRRLPQRPRSVEEEEEEEKIDIIGDDGLLPEERFLLHGDGEDNEDEDEDEDDDEYDDGDTSFDDAPILRYVPFFGNDTRINIDPKRFLWNAIVVVRFVDKRVDERGLCDPRVNEKVDKSVESENNDKEDEVGALFLRKLIKVATQRAVCGNANLLRGALKKIGVAFSATHGWGAFALETIRRGDFVYEYTGALISDDEAERRGSVYDAMRLSYLFDVNRDEVVDALRKGNKIKFANHRPNGGANLETKILRQRGEHRIALFAKRDIAIGEELFFDYGYTNETAPAWSQVRAPHNLHCDEEEESEVEEVLIGAGDSGDEEDDDE
ncbi:hypothetical protein ATCC90586_001425 [Pythium insidiosum]|nr:hypothetical protein ATCC90586_001425 [Pythium insidiosum]